MLQKLQLWFRRRQLREGEKISRFIARDVRRDILIVSAAKLDEGIITARVRTVNVLYLARGLAQEPEFGPPAEVRIESMWEWTGRSWGGLGDGTSIGDGSHESAKPLPRPDA